MIFHLHYSTHSNFMRFRLLEKKMNVSLCMGESSENGGKHVEFVRAHDISSTDTTGLLFSTIITLAGAADSISACSNG